MSTNYKIRLKFLSGENEGIESNLNDNSEYVIGRSDKCEICLAEKKVSRRHARLEVQDGSAKIEDLGSTNGTYLNGDRIRTSAEISDGDTIRVGNSNIRLFMEQVSQPVKKSPKPEIKTKTTKKSMRAPTMTGILPGSSAEKASEDKELAPINLDDHKLDVDEGIESAIRSSLSSGSSESNPSIEFDIVGDDYQDPPAADSSNISIGIEIDSGGDEDDEPSAGTSSDGCSGEVSGVQSKVGIHGRLEALPLSDLLQTLVNSRQQGVLVLEGQQRAKIMIKPGSMQYAWVEGEITGMKAVSRMLSWKDAEFKFHLVDDHGYNELLSNGSYGDTLDQSIDQILLEGYRQVDEIEKVKSMIPAASTKVVVNPDTENPLSKLHPKVLDVYQLLMKGMTVGEVIDASPYSDLETSKMIFYLLKKEYIVTTS